MQNTQKPNMLGCIDQSVCPETYGRLCIFPPNDRNRKEKKNDSTVLCIYGSNFDSNLCCFTYSYICISFTQLRNWSSLMTCLGRLADSHIGQHHLGPNIHVSQHCKDLHLQYISTTSLEMGSTSLGGVRLPDVLHYIFSTSPLHLSVVIIGTT